jgi:hypothetical protein
MPEFATVEEAYEWMEAEVDDPCIDNHRFCFLNVGEQVAEFEAVAAQGCCGSFEKDVLINGIPARIGCNYGH